MQLRGAVAGFPSDQDANVVVARVLVGTFISCSFSPTALWILWHLLRGQLTPQRVFLVGALIEFVCCFQVLIKPGRT